jgi:diguanylate cyclase (GGDEF)-like protein
VSLIMADVDHFKQYNDHLGHLAGDRCLREVAQAMAEVSRRPGDLLARYGGEEFVLLLPETDLPGAESLGQRLLERIDALALPHPESSVGPNVSVTVGVCGGRPGHAEPSQLIAQADAAMYAAKAAGRHRIGCRALDEVLLPHREPSPPRPCPAGTPDARGALRSGESAGVAQSDHEAEHATRPANASRP